MSEINYSQFHPRSPGAQQLQEADEKLERSLGLPETDGVIGDAELSAYQDAYGPEARAKLEGKLRGIANKQEQIDVLERQIADAGVSVQDATSRLEHRQAQFAQSERYGEYGELETALKADYPGLESIEIAELGPPRQHSAQTIRVSLTFAGFAAPVDVEFSPSAKGTLCRSPADADRIIRRFLDSTSQLTENAAIKALLTGSARVPELGIPRVVVQPYHDVFDKVAVHTSPVAAETVDHPGQAALLHQIVTEQVLSLRQTLDLSRANTDLSVRHVISDDDGAVIWDKKGPPPGIEGELSVEIAEADRAELTARGLVEKPWGFEIMVAGEHRKFPMVLFNNTEVRVSLDPTNRSVLVIDWTDPKESGTQRVSLATGETLKQ